MPEDLAGGVNTAWDIVWARWYGVLTHESHADILCLKHVMDCVPELS